MKVFLISIIVVILDQITKLTVRYYCEYEHRYKIIGDWVRLTYIENQGMAFGIQVGGGQPFFTIFAVIATVIIFVYILKARDEKLSLRFALALILGGAIGNLIDCFLYGAVVDFVDIGDVQVPSGVDRHSIRRSDDQEFADGSRRSDLEDAAGASSSTGEDVP